MTGNQTDSLTRTLPATASIARPANGSAQKLLYGLAIFASAFLLFQVEPIIAKMILPWFGGVAAVWAVCLLFFQVVLLLGYLYAHLLTSKFHPRVQARIHVVLLLLGLLALRIVPRDAWKPEGPEHPIARILLLLCATVSLPFFLLSTTSPLLQAWYAKRLAAEPYRFYALSNAGSVLGLLSYPIVIEPWVSTSQQAAGWSVAFAFVIVLCAAIAALSKGRNSNSLALESESSPATPAPSSALRLLWLALAACSSALLLSVTNQISQNIASVPFLWILPLTLYLVSFILCFDTRRWYRRDFFLRLLGIAIGGMTYALAPSFAGLPWKALILLFCLGFFVCCMFCHGELARLKPAPAHLTSFYLMISLGSAIGALFVALFAPLLFSGYYELHIAIGLCAILVLVVHYHDPARSLYKADPRRERGGMNPAAQTRRGGIFNPVWLVMGVLVLAVIVSLCVTARDQSADARVALRNFYGVLRVLNGADPNVVLLQGNAPQHVHYDPGYLKLMNGTIDHGLQYQAPALRREPTTYYGRNSGIGVTLRAAGAERALNVGAIGLGVGTVAAYAKPGDRYTFYEINPLDVKIANQEFSFLRDSPAAINIELGDARLSLEREVTQNFDVLIVDAFTGDSIPVHLLTRQAFALYFCHLKPDGVLALHISNQYLDLEPVVAGAASSLGKEAVLINRDVEKSKGVYPATWILVGNRGGFLAQADIERTGQILPANSARLQLWTDDYSSLWRVLK